MIIGTSNFQNRGPVFCYLNFSNYKQFLKCYLNVTFRVLLLEVSCIEPVGSYYIQ